VKIDLLSTLSNARYKPYAIDAFDVQFGISFIQKSKYILDYFKESMNLYQGKILK
jgi:hypothetical protein